MYQCRRVPLHKNTHCEGRTFSINIEKARETMTCYNDSSPMKPRRVFVTLTNKAQLQKYNFKYKKGSLVKLKKQPQVNRVHRIVATDLQTYQR